MQIQILDVAHGFCAYVVADTGSTMLIDCGHNATTNLHPADHLKACNCQGIQRFFVLNYDEDHLSGLPRLKGCIPINTLHRNTTVSPDVLRLLKMASGTLGLGMRALLEMLAIYTSPEQSPPPDFGNLQFSLYWNEYPDFIDTNNLSLVLFLRYPGISVIFPGDMEKPGWARLLQNPSFLSELSRVNIFVASHHGRESGYAPEVFKVCAPEVVIISDEEMRYDTQEHCYAQHARGITWNGTEMRRVLTTRKDGTLTIMNRGGGFYIQASC